MELCPHKVWAHIEPWLPILYFVCIVYIYIYIIYLLFVFVDPVVLVYVLICVWFDAGYHMSLMMFGFWLLVQICMLILSLVFFSFMLLMFDVLCLFVCFVCVFVIVLLCCLFSLWCVLGSVMFVRCFCLVYVHVVCSCSWYVILYA